jgi:hypothetical protein
MVIYEVFQDEILFTLSVMSAMQQASRNGPEALGLLGNKRTATKALL